MQISSKGVLPSIRTFNSLSYHAILHTLEIYMLDGRQFLLTSTCLRVYSLPFLLSPTPLFLPSPSPFLPSSLSIYAMSSINESVFLFTLYSLQLLMI